MDAPFLLLFRREFDIVKETENKRNKGERIT